MSLIKILSTFSVCFYHKSYSFLQLEVVVLTRCMYGVVIFMLFFLLSSGGFSFYF